MLQITLNQFNEHENHCKPRKSLKIAEYRWKSLKISGNRGKSLKITENHWKSLKITENHWKSLKIIINYWKLLKITENQLNLIVFRIGELVDDAILEDNAAKAGNYRAYVKEHDLTILSNLSI